MAKKPKKGKRYKAPRSRKIGGEMYDPVGAYPTKRKANQEAQFHRDHHKDKARVVKTPKSVRVRKEHNKPWMVLTSRTKRKQK